MAARWASDVKQRGRVQERGRACYIAEIWHPAGVREVLGRLPGVSQARPPATVWQPSGLAGGWHLLDKSNVRQSLSRCTQRRGRRCRFHLRTELRRTGYHRSPRSSRAIMGVIQRGWAGQVLAAVGEGGHGDFLPEAGWLAMVVPRSKAGSRCACPRSPRCWLAFQSVA